MSGCPEGCPYLPRIEALEKESRHNKDAHKEFYGKLESSNTSIALIEQRLNQIKETVQVMKDKPGKRWDGFVEKAAWAVCAAVIAFLLGRIGL